MIGAVERENFRVGSSMPGQLIACIGVPKVGAEVSLDDPETVDLLLLKTLLELDYVSDIIPVGSKGIGYEAGVLAATAGLKAAFDTRLDLEKSAGPATCLLTSLWPDKLEDLARRRSAGGGSWTSDRRLRVVWRYGNGLQLYC